MVTKAKMVAEALLKALEQLRLDTARKDALLADRDRAIAERDAQISELAREDAKLVRLKTAAIDLGLSYETARKWCTRGFLKSARQQGSLWLVDTDELRTVAAMRLPPAEQKRSLG